MFRSAAGLSWDAGVVGAATAQEGTAPGIRTGAIGVSAVAATAATGMERPAKRTATCAPRRASVGAACGGRPSRSRTSIAQHRNSEDAENAVPGVKQQPSESKTAVLADVTNTAGGHQLMGKVARPCISLAHAVPATQQPPGASLAHAAAAQVAMAPRVAAAAPAQAPPRIPAGSAPAAGLMAPATAGSRPLLAGLAQAVARMEVAAPVTAGEDREANPVVAEDPQSVAEYVPDIYDNLQRGELRCLPDPSYMEQQPHINAKMRAILVDWLVDVHKKYKLRSETLFLAIGLMDRFLERRQTARLHLQLVGVAALLIASKFEEIHPPQVNDFVYITDKAYTSEDVLRMEVSMLTVLEFQVCCPTAAHFMERYQRVNGCTEAHRDLAQYLLELTLTEYSMVRYTPSHLAAAALFLSNRLLRRQPAWTVAMARRTGLTEQLLRECAREICNLLEGAESSQMHAVRRKYSQLKHHAVAKMNFAAEGSHRCQRGASTPGGGAAEPRDPNAMQVDSA